MAKSADAFRSIGEVARLIGVAPHVLRYWETQFPQLAPVKRADGRRYYRPDDVKLAAGLCEVMREDGMTARGALRLMADDKGAGLRARGAERVAAMLAAEGGRAQTVKPRRGAGKPDRAAATRAPAAAPSLPLFPEAEVRASALLTGGAEQPGLKPQASQPESDMAPAGFTPPESGAPSVPGGDAANPDDAFSVVMPDDDAPESPAAAIGVGAAVTGGDGACPTHAGAGLLLRLAAAEAGLRAQSADLPAAALAPIAARLRALLASGDALGRGR